METWMILGWGAVIAFLYFALFWVLQYRLNNAGIVDVGWALGVAAVGGWFAWQADGDLIRRGVGIALMTLWALRLSLYLYVRWRSHEEDPRYTALKIKWGAAAQWRMFRFYQMQGLGAFAFAIPLLLASSVDQPWQIWDTLAVLVWCVAITGEALADQQLKRFKADPDNRGEVCQSGLWKYSRHPNYFFEWLHWWTYVLLAVLHPWGWLSVLVPLAMWFFLTRVTGIPTAESQSVRTRGDKYRQYQKSTSAFFPWFPKTVN